LCTKKNRRQQKPRRVHDPRPDSNPQLLPRASQYLGRCLVLLAILPVGRYRCVIRMCRSRRVFCGSSSARAACVCCVCGCGRWVCCVCCLVCCEVGGVECARARCVCVACVWCAVRAVCVCVCVCAEVPTRVSYGVVLCVRRGSCRAGNSFAVGSLGHFLFQ
jgi:hypothetical protein